MNKLSGLRCFPCRFINWFFPYGSSIMTSHPKGRGDQDFVTTENNHKYKKGWLSESSKELIPKHLSTTHNLSLLFGAKFFSSFLLSWSSNVYFCFCTNFSCDRSRMRSWPGLKSRRDERKISVFFSKSYTFLFLLWQ